MFRKQHGEDDGSLFEHALGNKWEVVEQRNSTGQVRYLLRNGSETSVEWYRTFRQAERQAQRFNIGNSWEDQ